MSLYNNEVRSVLTNGSFALQPISQAIPTSREGIQAQAAAQRVLTVYRDLIGRRNQLKLLTIFNNVNVQTIGGPLSDEDWINNRAAEIARDPTLHAWVSDPRNRKMVRKAMEAFTGHSF